jgi:HNH endonuclease
VLIEAGHRCAIPTCRAYPVVIDHIDDWARVREHRFENLIALCPTCHARKGNGRDKIDRPSLKIYKANLGLLNSRYGEYERRLLEQFGTTYQEDRETWDRVRQQGGSAAMALVLPPPDGIEVTWDPTYTRNLPLVETLPFGQKFLMSYLIRDGHLVLLPSPDFGLRLREHTVFEAYALTASGMELVERLVEGEPLK